MAFAIAALVLHATGQEGVQHLPAPPQAEDVPLYEGPGVGTEALPGREPGTRRYNVTFRTRSFDLSEFRDAIRFGQPAEVVEAIVRDLDLRARTDQEPFRKAVEELGGRVDFQFWLINACTIEIAPEHLEKVRAMDNVLFVHPDVATYPLGPAATPMIRISTNSNNHNADAEQALGNKGTGWSVAIVDTSQDDNYQNAANTPHRTYYRDGNRSNKTAGGIDGSRLLANVQIGTQPANNTHLHGTGVASIAAGGNWGTAQADHGHAYDAGIVGYAICNAWPSCSSSHATQAAAWQRVAADKVRYNIVSANMSYGSSPDPTNVSQQAVDALALNADVLPVTAAGNSSSSTTGSSSTANGLAVGAVNANTKTMASFSSRGPLSGDTQRFFPDIAANGVSTIMARANDETTNYTASGTSMAAPHVAGAAVLLKNARPSNNNIPFSWTPLTYQQVFLGSELPAAFSATGLGLRQDEAFGNRVGFDVDLEIALGYTTFDQATITDTFASNFNSGTRVVVLPRTNVRLPDMAAAPTDPNVFFLTIPFPSPFAYAPASGRNLLIEVINRGNGNNNSTFTYPLDAASGTATTRIYGTGTTGALGRTYGLVLCFRGAGGGAIPLLTNRGMPVLGQSFSVDLRLFHPRRRGPHPGGGGERPE